MRKIDLNKVTVFFIVNCSFLLNFFILKRERRENEKESGISHPLIEFLLDHNPEAGAG